MRPIVLSFLIMMFPALAVAQWRTDNGHASDSLSRFDWHLSLATGVSVGNGATVSFLRVAPHFEFHPNNRLTLRAGFSVLNTTSFAPFLQLNTACRTPYRHSPGSALALRAFVAGEYWLSDRLWIAAALSIDRGSAFFPGGWSPWGFIPNGAPYDLNRVGFAAELRYHFDNDSFLRIYLNFNNGGAPFPYNPYHDFFYNCDPFASPFAPSFSSPASFFNVHACY